MLLIPRFRIMFHFSLQMHKIINLFLTLQEDLEFVKVGGKKKLVGFVDLGRSYDDYRILTEGKIIDVCNKRCLS